MHIRLRLSAYYFCMIWTELSLCREILVQTLQNKVVVRAELFQSGACPDKQNKAKWNSHFSIVLFFSVTSSFVNAKKSLTILHATPKSQFQRHSKHSGTIATPGIYNMEWTTLKGTTTTNNKVKLIYR